MPAFTPGGLLRRFFGSAVSNAAGYAVGGAISPTLEPYTQELANVTWHANPSKPLSAQTAAELAFRGIPLPSGYADEAAFTGYDTGRFDALLANHGDAPPIATVLELLRRGEATPAQATAAFRRNGMIEAWRDKLLTLRYVLPSVTDMVRFAVREVYNPAQRSALDLDAEFPDAFAADAARIGLDREVAGNYWAAHWELPSYTQGTEMLFRGEISPAQFTSLLKALDYAPTWRGPLEAIARRIPTITDMIRFAVREVYNPTLRKQLGIDAEYPTAFTAQAAMHGMSEEYARQYWAAHWRLPSAQQGYRMLWRGEITADELDALLKALDYPPVWRDRLANIAHIVPGRIDTKRLFKFGLITRAQAVGNYVRIGYAPADAEMMVKIAEAEQGATSTRLSYVDKARNTLFTRVHAEAVALQLSEPEIDAGLEAVGVPDAEREPLKQLWTAEAKIRRTELTPAQIRKAYKKALYTEQEALAELEERGMTAEDADIFLKSG